MFIRREIRCRDEISASELYAGRGISKHVVLSARLRAGSAIRAALGDHAGHEALARVRDAQRAVHERLETEIGHALANCLQVIEGVLARQHYALHAELLEHRGPRAVVHRRLRRAVDLQIWVQLPNQADEAEGLNDHRVNAAVDCLTEKGERLCEVTRFDENVQGAIDATAAAAPAATRTSG